MSAIWCCDHCQSTVAGDHKRNLPNKCPTCGFGNGDAVPAKRPDHYTEVDL